MEAIKWTDAKEHFLTLPSIDLFFCCLDLTWRNTTSMTIPSRMPGSPFSDTLQEFSSMATPTSSKLREEQGLHWHAHNHRIKTIASKDKHNSGPQGFYFYLFYMNIIIMRYFFQMKRQFSIQNSLNIYFCVQTTS